MKKLLALILSLTLCGAFFAGCTNDDGSSSSSSSSSSSPFGEVSTPEEPEPEAVTYTITYYAVIDGATPTTTIPADMKDSNGQYPVSYVYGVGAVVSNLTDTATYDFQGWYVDASCSVQATLPISATSAVNQTLYAKIATITQDPQGPQNPEPPTPVVKTITYYAVINGGTPVAVPDELKTTGANYPVEYTVGVGATISPLQDANEYDFIGWYVNQACDNAFAGMIGTTENGDVTLYAKVETEAKITYRAVVDGEVKTFNNMSDFKKGDPAVYPEKYTYNTATTIDDLKSFNNYEFGGWYTDEECQTEFEGEIPANQRGEFVLYAKITDLNNDIYWTPNY